MITYIRGILEGMEEDKVIVDVGGVGYGGNTVQQAE